MPWNRNVNRRCFYSNSSLGGTLSRLILSVIKALLGEGMKRSGGRRGSRQRWAKVRRWRWTDGQLRGLMRKYVKGGERSPGGGPSISGGPAGPGLARTHMSGPEPVLIKKLVDGVDGRRGPGSPPPPAPGDERRLSFGGMVRRDPITEVFCPVANWAALGTWLLIAPFFSVWTELSLLLVQRTPPHPRPSLAFEFPPSGKGRTVCRVTL